MKNRVKVTIAALTIGVLAMCGNMTGYATESADAVSTQANEDGSTDAGGSNQNIYTVTYNLNGGTKDGKDTFERSYYSESWNVDLSAIKPTRSGYRLTGWWYTNTNDTEQKIDTNETINLEEVFPDIREATLTAEWTQVVDVTVDGKETGTKVAAGNTISVEAPSNTLKLDKWVVNASDANNGWELKPNNNEGTIKVEPAAVEKHVINVDGEKTGFGITKDNAKANFVSYWSLQEGYLVQIENKTGHPLKLTDTVTVPNDDKQILEMGSQLPEKTTDGYFTIINRGINTENQAYIEWKDLNVKCTNLTIGKEDVVRNMKIFFATQEGVTYTEGLVSDQVLKSGATLNPQQILDTVNKKAIRNGFEKYRWSYSVRNDQGQWISADNISSNAWSSDVNADILQKKFDFSFPYYEFKFEPVWQCQINFETGFPTTETEGVPKKPASLEQDEKSIFTKFPELNDSKNRYEFKGWKLERDTSNTLYKNNTKYTVTSPSVTFVGQWEAIDYPIHWNIGYEGGGSTEDSIAYGTSISFPTDPTRPGYTFLGWEMSVGDASTDNGVKTSEQLYKAGDEVMMPAGAVTMIAQWQINTYTVTYNGNGGTIGIYTGRDDVTYNASYKIKNVSGITPTRFGYQFCGWKINGSGDTLQAGSSFTMPAKDVTLVAQWEATSSKSYKMEQGVGYTYNGTFRIKGDPSNYQDKITFYVPKAGEYTFE